MAVIAGTFQSTGATMNRETLSDVVSRITPEDTPVYSKIEKVTFKGTHPEWGTDDLVAPGDNAFEEGDQYDFDNTDVPDRYGNHTQILRKTGRISESQEASDEAGNVVKLKESKLKRAIELRKDVEYSIVAANPSVGGATRYSGSLSTWIETNANRGAGGANGGFNATTGLTVAPTNGGQRAFTKGIMDDVAQQGYMSGANFRDLYVSPYLKSVFVTFMSDANVATFRYAATSGKNNSIVANADVYEGPHGKLMVHQNRVMAGSAALARNAFYVDDDHLCWGWFRKMKEDKQAGKFKHGDAKQFVIIGEGGLKPKNEKGLGVAADLYGINATS